MILMAHPTGNEFVRHAALAFQEAGLLEEFWTCLSWASHPSIDRLLPATVRRELERRALPAVLRPRVRTHGWREAGRLLCTRVGWRYPIRHEQGWFSVDAVYQSLDKSVAKRLRGSLRTSTGVYVFEDGALETLTTARELGLTAYYDLPIGYWRTARKLMEGEFARMPEWSNTLTGFQDSPEKLNRKDAELSLATAIIVASSFTASTLRDYPGHLPAPIVVPYGFPPVASELHRPIRGPVTIEKPLRLLFVGGLSQRKGIADLFAAVNQIGRSVSLTIIGQKSTADCPALDKELARHRWIPSLPHGKILEEMRVHDVLIFPSLFEGFGLVITEAMSQGTPVITTERTAGPDLITHDENGWLIKAGSTEALVHQLEKLVKDPESVREAGIHAVQTAAKRPWSVYGHEIASAIERTAMA